MLVEKGWVVLAYGGVGRVGERCRKFRCSVVESSGIQQHH